jgi:hypothetical protein
VRAPISPRISSLSGLETRGLDALAREELVDRFSVDAQHATDANRVEPTVVNQAPDRLGVDAKLVRDFTNADEVVRLLSSG